MTLKEKLDAKVLAQRQVIVTEQQRLDEVNSKALQDLPTVIFDMIQKEFLSCSTPDLLHDDYTVSIVRNHSSSEKKSMLTLYPSGIVLADITELYGTTVEKIMLQVTALADAQGLSSSFLEVSFEWGNPDTWKFTYVPPAAK